MSKADKFATTLYILGLIVATFKGLFSMAGGNPARWETLEVWAFLGVVGTMVVLITKNQLIENLIMTLMVIIIIFIIFGNTITRFFPW